MKSSQALQNNPKIEVMDGDTFRFLPALTGVKDKKSLLRALDRNDQAGLGGTEMDDVEESVPRFKKTLRVRHNSLIFTFSFYVSPSMKI